MAEVMKKNIGTKYLFPCLVALLLFENIELAGIGRSLYSLGAFVIVFLMLLSILSGNGESKRIYMGLHVVLLMLFIAACILSAFNAEYPNASYKRTLEFSQYTLFAIVISMYLFRTWNSEDWILLEKFALAVSAIAAASIITDLVGITSFSRWFASDFVPLFSRPSGIFGEPNYSAAKLAVMLPFCISALIRYIEERRKVKSIVTACIVSMVVFAVLLTGSRVGLLISIFVIFVYAIRLLFLSIRNRKALIFAVILVILVTIVILNIPIGIAELFQTAGFQITISRYENVWNYLVGRPVTGESSIQERSDLLEYGIELYKENPISGIGIDNFKYYAGNKFGKDEIVAHNTFIGILAETGTFGAIFYFSLFAYILFSYVISRDILEGFFFPLFISYISLLIMLSFLSNYQNKLFWGLFLPISMYLEAERR